MVLPDYCTICRGWPITIIYHCQASSAIMNHINHADDLPPPGDDEDFRRRMAESNRVSQALATHMLQGWAMLAETCPRYICVNTSHSITTHHHRCATPLVRSRSQDVRCVCCDMPVVLTVNDRSGTWSYTALCTPPPQCCGRQGASAPANPPPSIHRGGASGITETHPSHTHMPPRCTRPVGTAPHLPSTTSTRAGRLDPRRAEQDAASGRGDRGA